MIIKVPESVGLSGSQCLPAAISGSGTSSMSSLYDMICGVGKSTTIQDSTGVASASSQTPVSSLTPEQKAEKKTMPSELSQKLSDYWK